MRVHFLGWEDLLVEGMATNSSILAWRIPGAEEPGRLQSIESHRIGHDWSDLIHGPDIPGSYAILLFTASDFASITSHGYTWVLFLLWLCLFILSGVIYPLISSSILGTYWPGEFIFQCPIFLPFHTVHPVLNSMNSALMRALHMEYPWMSLDYPSSMEGTALSAR